GAARGASRGRPAPVRRHHRRRGAQRRPARQAGARGAQHRGAPARVMADTASVSEWQPRWRELVQGVVRVHTERGEQQLLESLAHPGEPMVLAFVNAHAMNSAATSRKFYESLMSADIVLRDGIGMAILLRMLNQAPGLNLNGTDLIPKILKLYSGRSIALFGTQDPYLRRARERVKQQLAPGSMVLTTHGFLETADYVHLAAKHKPELIVLGMGM